MGLLDHPGPAHICRYDDGTAENPLGGASTPNPALGITSPHFRPVTLLPLTPSRPSEAEARPLGATPLTGLRAKKPRPTQKLRPTKPYNPFAQSWSRLAPNMLSERPRSQPANSRPTPAESPPLSGLGASAPPPAPSLLHLPSACHREAPPPGWSSSLPWRLGLPLRSPAPQPVSLRSLSPSPHSS